MQNIQTGTNQGSERESTDMSWKKRPGSNKNGNFESPDVAADSCLRQDLRRRGLEILELKGPVLARLGTRNSRTYPKAPTLRIIRQVWGHDLAMSNCLKIGKGLYSLGRGLEIFGYLKIPARTGE